MALSVCTKIDKVFDLTSTVRDCLNIFPPVPCTVRVYCDSDSIDGICNYTAKYHNFLIIID